MFIGKLEYYGHVETVLLYQAGCATPYARKEGSRVQGVWWSDLGHVCPQKETVYA